MGRETFFRWLFFSVGLITLGLGVALTIKGQRFGVGSWDVLHIGLFQKLGLTIGTWSIILGVLIIVISSIGLRELPKIGTFINMTIVGVFIDFFNWIIPNPANFILQLGAFISGTILLSIGCGMYISANLGAGPRDSLMMLAVSKLKWSVGVVRTVMEIFVACAGYLLGGPVGVGTVIMALSLGPIIQISLKQSQNVLKKITSTQQMASNH